jgi:hypothetical protein
MAAPQETKPGHVLLREAIDDAKAHDAEVTDARVAREVFGVSAATLSQWCTGKARPGALFRAIALLWASVPADSWYDADDRKQLRAVAKLEPRKLSPNRRAAA